MTNSDYFVLLLACAIGIAGLFLAASSGGETTYAIGLLLTVGAVVYAFLFVKRHFDRIDRQRH